MDFINEFVKNIVVCVLILNIVECLIASKEYDKYIRVFTGIIVIIAIRLYLLAGHQ